MEQPIDRRTLLRVGAMAGGAVVAGTGTASADHGEENPSTVDGSTPYRAKVTDIRYPLAGVPALEPVDGILRVELATGIDPSTVSATLVPSFGRARRRVNLTRTATDADPDGSRIWNEAEGETETVSVARFRVPDVVPALYDLEVSWPEGEDRQPRAVRVFESIPAEPQVAVIADPQLGDPRAFGTGAQESADEGSPDPFVDRTSKLAGDGPRDRWQATRRAVAEVNLLDPDFVFVAGDLTFGQDAPGKYYAEYEDAWSILNELRVPSFCTLGNHDGYVQSGTDGKALYRETFGPPSYAVDVGEVTVVAVDTYDWSYLDRFGSSVAVSTYGGRVRDAQFNWLQDALRDAAADGQSILAFGHHNPSWRPDPKTAREEETDGTPVAEQVARGSRYVESGQLWTGPAVYRVRRLFDATGVDAFFSGHSHRDRIARTLRDDNERYADIVETPGPRSRKGRDEPYHLLAYTAGGEDTRVGPPVTIERVDAGDHLADTLRDGTAGTCYVNCTTTQSSTGQYWGLRSFRYDPAAAGFDPTWMRYPTSRKFLDQRAVNPDAWNAEHDEVGLFSTPTYLLSVERKGSANAPTGRQITVTNDHPVPLTGAVLASVSDPEPAVEGAEVVWSRTEGRQTDLKLAVDVSAVGETTIVIR